MYILVYPAMPSPDVIVCTERPSEYAPTINWEDKAGDLLVVFPCKPSIHEVVEPYCRPCIPGKS